MNKRPSSKRRCSWVLGGPAGQRLCGAELPVGAAGPGPLGSDACVRERRWAKPNGGSCRILAQNQPNGLPLAPQPGWLRPGPPLEEHRLDLEGEADPEGGAGGCPPSTQLTAAWVLPGAREDDASATGTSFAK